MTDEYSRAISFANNYFALVDGLAYGLEEHLAEDVSLNWFGKTVTGKRNVAAFMRINMTNSRHMFDDITPASGILKKRRARRKCKSKEVSPESTNVPDPLLRNLMYLEKLYIDDLHERKEKKGESIEPSPVAHRGIVPICAENITEDSTEGNDTDHSLASAKMECATNVSQSNSESSMKFIKANGIVHIHRSSGPNKIRKWHSSGFVSGLPGQSCRRHCKLQVAYTCRGDQTTGSKDKPVRSRSACANKERRIELGDSSEKKYTQEFNAMTSKGRKRLNSQEDEEMQEESPPAFNPFEDFDRFDDKQRFLEYFDAEMAPKFNFTSAKYVGDRLVFDWTKKNDSAGDNRINSFKFNYSIHMLVYESNATSSLTEEFEDRKSLSDTEKSV